MVNTFFTDLKNKFEDSMRGSKPIATLTSSIFPPTDTEKIKKDLKIKQMAQEDGAHNIPIGNAKLLSSIELEIQSRLQIHLDEHLANYHKYEDIYQERYVDCKKISNLDLITNKEQALVDDIVGEGKSIAGGIFKYSQEMLAASNQLYLFRKKHSLLDRVPEVLDKYKVYLILLIAVLVETFVTYYLARDAGSTIMVIIISGTYCIVNCLIPYYFSHFVRWINFNPAGYEAKKILGWITALFIAVFVIALNIGMGHYRGAGINYVVGDVSSTTNLFSEIQMQQSLVTDAWQNFLYDPFGLPDILSWLLVLVGVLVAVVALFDGLRKNDIYPGYGEAATYFNNCYAEYRRELESVLENIQDLRTDAVAEINAIKYAFTLGVNEVSALVNSCESMHSACLKSLEQVNKDFKQLATLYRQENMKKRTEEPPKYFTVDPLIEYEVPPAPVFEKIEIDEDAVFQYVKEFSERLHGALDKVVNELNEPSKILHEDHPLRVDM
jgi:hypothetical protein